MLKEERAAIRSTWEKWHADSNIRPTECFKCTGRNTHDVLMLLDALDEMEILIEAERAKRPIEITGDAATSAILALELSEMQADRDRWKVQTEARDRALKAWCCRLTCKNADIEYICDENRCKNINLAELSGEWECVNWQFDQERYTIC